MAYVEFSIAPVIEIPPGHDELLRERFMNMMDLAFPAIVLPKFGAMDAERFHAALGAALDSEVTLGSYEAYRLDAANKRDELRLHIDKIRRQPDVVAWSLEKSSVVGTFFLPKPALFSHRRPPSTARAYAERNARIIGMQPAYKKGRVDDTYVVPVAYRTKPLNPGDAILFPSQRVAHDLDTQAFPRRAFALEYGVTVHDRTEPFPLVRQPGKNQG